MYNITEQCEENTIFLIFKQQKIQIFNLQDGLPVF